MNVIRTWFCSLGIRLMFYAQVLGYMISIDLLAMKGRTRTKIITSLIPFLFQTFVLLFVLPKIGISRSYTQLVVISRFFISDSIGIIAALISGLDNGGALSYLFSTPAPAWLIFMGVVCGYALRMFLLTVVLTPIAIFVLFFSIDISSISILQFLIAFGVHRFFDSVFGLCLASVTGGLGEVARMWSRVINPLSFLATFSPAWPQIIGFYPHMGFLLLANPFLYVHEMGRSAMFGSISFIPFWVCILVLFLTSAVLALLGIYRLKKRFDLV